MIQRKELIILALGLAVVLGLSFIPVLIYGYTFPPCIYIPGHTCDPVVLQGMLTWSAHGYYGHFPAMFLGMNIYYRLTPVFILIGLWVLLRRYGMLTVFMSWVALFFITRVIAFDLHNGTFVGLINFYFWGFILIRFIVDWIEKRNTGLIPSILASFMVFFHAFTGIVMFAGVILYAVITRKLPPLYVSFLLGISVLASYFLLPSSITRVDVLPTIASVVVDVLPTATSAAVDVLPTTTSVVDTVGRLVEYSTMDIVRFVSEYVGYGSWIYFLLAAITAIKCWTIKDNFPKDRAMWMLFGMCIPLAFMTFSIFALNADRTAKLLVGVLIVLSTVIITEGLSQLKSRRLYGLAGVMILLALTFEVPKLIPYWMAMGSYE